MARVIWEEREGGRSSSSVVVVVVVGVGVMMAVLAVIAAAAAGDGDGDRDVDRVVVESAGWRVESLDVRSGSGSGSGFGLVASAAGPSANHDAVSKASDEGGIGGRRRRDRGRPRSAGLTPVLSV